MSVLECVYPAGFGSFKAVTNCFWPKKVRHINGLFELENESGWLHFEMSKKSNKWKNGKQSISRLKPRCPRRSTDVITIDQRAEHRHYDSNVTTQGTGSTLRTLGKLQQNVGNRMVLTYNDVGRNPKRPQIGVLLIKEQ